VSKVESKSKDETEPKIRTAPGPEFNRMLKKPTFSQCPKCKRKRFVEEPGMEGTKHCPDCGHYEGLKEWAEAHS